MIEKSGVELKKQRSNRTMAFACAAFFAGMIGVAGAYAFLPFVEDEPEIFGDDAQGRYDSQPINFVDGDEPPMLLLQGTDDEEVPPNNAEGMAERAQAMDGTATLKSDVTQGL